MTYQLLAPPHHISNPAHYFSQKTETNKMAWLIQNKQNKTQKNKGLLAHEIRKWRTRKHRRSSPLSLILFLFSLELWMQAVLGSCPQSITTK